MMRSHARFPHIILTDAGQTLPTLFQVHFSQSGCHRAVRRRTEATGKLQGSYEKATQRRKKSKTMVPLSRLAYTEP